MEPLGVVLGVLGAVLGALGTVFWSNVAARQFLKKIKIDFELVFRSKSLPKGSQNGVKNVPKSKHKSKMKKASLWDRVWVVLGSFWCQC